MVSIICVTYNQEAYIREAIEGFLMQETDFPFEVYIHDDASTDHTSQIVREYETKWPNKIHGVYEVENQYSNGPLGDVIKYRILPLCKGKYIALCEGDDCWIDTQKLQIQVDYMEKHPDCSMYLHNALWMDYTEKKIKPGNPFELDVKRREQSRILSAEEIIEQNNKHPSTASFLFKRQVYDKDDFFIHGPVGDYFILLAALTEGYIYYSGRIMAIYRYRTRGSYTDKLGEDLLFSLYYYVGFLEVLCLYDRYTNYKYHKYLAWRMQLYAYFFLNKTDDTYTNAHQVVEQCRKNGYSVGAYCEYIAQELNRLRQQINDEQYLSEKTKEFIKKYQYIWIMGAGKYASILALQLMNHKIDFEGFVVTELKPEQKVYMGKEIRGLEHVADMQGKFGLIVGINPFTDRNIREQLDRAGIEDCLFPFEFGSGL